MKNKSIINTSKIPMYFAILLFIILIIRMGQLALSPTVNGINLQQFALTRTTKKTVLKAKRGNIYDSEGNTLAQDVSSYTLIAYLDSSRTTDPDNPKHVVDKNNTALILAQILDMDYDTIYKYLSKENVYQVEFGPKGKGLTEIVKDKIKETNLPGLDFIETTKRYYPYGDFASYLIGYAKQDSEGNLVGELGIEKQYNEELTGTDGFTEYQKDRNGYKIAGTYEERVEAEDGDSIYLTIDDNVQFFVEEAMQKTSDYDYDSMSIVVAEAKTGKILGYGNYPSFDPNKLNITNYMDNISSVAFEPGSTMKIYTYMAAIESGVYKGSDTYLSGSFTTTDNTVIRDWNRAGWGYISYDKGFIYSSNTAVVNLMNKYMDANTLKKQLIKLGFGSKTGIETYNEASGKINFKYETEIYNAAFGQGITTTPIQHVKALTSIANDGNLLKPYIIDKIVDQDGNIKYQGSTEVLGKVASTETIEYLKNLMFHTINDSDGAAHNYYIQGYNIIGKTGTAQIANSNSKGYSTLEKDHNRSVAIMFPKDDPQIIIYGVVKRCETATPLSKAVKEIITNVSKYYDIYKENEIDTKTYKVTLSNYINKNTDEVKTNLESLGLKVLILGTGSKIINQYPSNKTNIIKGDTVILLTDCSEYTLPSLLGYSRNTVTNILDLLGLKYNITGNGYVISQSIDAGTIIDKEKIIELVLQPLF